MQRVTITLDEQLATDLDAYMSENCSENRSEAVRDLIRRALSDRSRAPQDARCVGVVTCAVDQSVRNLAVRVPQSRLDRHDLTVAALSVPLDHSTSLEVAVMRGRAGDVVRYSDSLFLERGVFHGALALIPVTQDEVSHVHNEGEPEQHTHLKVQQSF